MMKSDEIKFFSSLSKCNDWNYLPNIKASREIIKLSITQIYCNISSTLGYEAFARGKNSIYPNKRFLNETYKKSHRFAWPSDLPENESFWTNFVIRKIF